jgi:hypothetical protein
MLIVVAILEVRHRQFKKIARVYGTPQETLNYAYSEFHYPGSMHAKEQEQQQQEQQQQQQQQARQTDSIAIIRQPSLTTCPFGAASRSVVSSAGGGGGGDLLLGDGTYIGSIQ